MGQWAFCRSIAIASVPMVQCHGMERGEIGKAVQSPATSLEAEKRGEKAINFDTCSASVYISSFFSISTGSASFLTLPTLHFFFSSFFFLPFFLHPLLFFIYFLIPPPSLPSFFFIPPSSSLLLLFSSISHQHPPSSPPNDIHLFMDVYALTKKQRPTHLTRGEPNKTDSAMAPAEQPSQLPQLQRQQQQQQQQQSADLGAPPTLQDIEIRYSQLPPQYRQAVLEQQLLQYQQSQQRGATAAAAVTKSDTPRLPSFPSTSPSKESTYSNNNTTPHQRIASAPASSFRSDRSSATPSHTTSGPSRAHWKVYTHTIEDRLVCCC
ncbi:MAG: hypothetical protein J3Q66DRAFT_82303 [Benniella sp.]|nr:MAG: hypothetical protein J3Q66DRAFT_82303 [Benniella sp.]